MIAVSAIKGKYLTCDESRVEAHYRSGEIEIFVPARVDLAACLRDGVTTIKLQVHPPHCLRLCLAPVEWALAQPTNLLIFPTSQLGA